MELRCAGSGVEGESAALCVPSLHGSRYTDQGTVEGGVFSNSLSEVI
jgi:hypothetical protein